jgi:hypothetical protein
MSLQDFIIIFGAFELLLSQVTTGKGEIHDRRISQKGGSMTPVQLVICFFQVTHSWKQ